ncbi:uncharacterized protein BDV17DRAFT_288111 [Aspergillus undulatus]|uniref:uncharacterized protein n=1 Tax=Aspergillus undulatus TaxID=1810928 RepID=UPI003CCCA6DE
MASAFPQIGAPSPSLSLHNSTIPPPPTVITTAHGTSVALTETITDHIEAIRKMPGKSTLEPGDTKLVRCTKGAAIIWKNYVWRQIQDPPSYNNIADGVQVIKDICSFGRNNGKIAGTLDHGDN